MKSYTKLLLIAVPVVSAISLAVHDTKEKNKRLKELEEIALSRLELLNQRISCIGDEQLEEEYYQIEESLLAIIKNNKCNFKNKKNLLIEYISKIQQLLYKSNSKSKVVDLEIFKRKKRV